MNHLTKESEIEDAHEIEDAQTFHSEDEERETGREAQGDSLPLQQKIKSPVDIGE